MARRYGISSEAWEQAWEEPRVAQLRRHTALVSTLQLAYLGMGAHVRLHSRFGRGERAALGRYTRLTAV